MPSNHESDDPQSTKLWIIHPPFHTVSKKSGEDLESNFREGSNFQKFLFEEGENELKIRFYTVK